MKQFARKLLFKLITGRLWPVMPMRAKVWAFLNEWSIYPEP